jgi:uncharacterized protein
MIRNSAVFASALLAALAAAPLPAQPGPPAGRVEPVPHITVQGFGQVRSDPDVATVRLGVVAQEPTARAAQDRANRVAAAILEAITKLGVPREAVQTSDLSLGPVYSSPGPQERSQEPRISGYQASYVVSARLEKLDLVGPVVDAALGAGANRLQGVEFGLRNDRAARAGALEAAVRQARDKAQAIAGALGVRLGEVLEVAEGGFALATPKFSRMAMEAMDSAANTPIAAGQVGVDASVTVSFRIAGGG